MTALIAKEIMLTSLEMMARIIFIATVMILH